MIAGYYARVSTAQLRIGTSIFGGGVSYGGSSHTTILEFLECGSGSFGSFNELELALRAIGALRFGRHDCGSLGRIKAVLSLIIYKRGG